MESIEQPAAIESAPPPPSYYYLFKERDKFPLPPPTIPSDFQPRILAFNGLPNMLPSQDMPSNNQLKSTMKRLLDEIVKSALELAGNVGGHQRPQALLGPIDGLLNEFHQMLAYYREHEAREELCEGLKRQLHESTELYYALQRIVDKYRHYNTAQPLTSMGWKNMT